MSILKVKDGGVAKQVSVEIAGTDDTLLVHKTGIEEIDGRKDFVVSPTVPTVSDVTDATTKVASTAFIKKVIDALYPVGSVVLGSKPAIGTWTQVGQTKILSNSDDQYIVIEHGNTTIGDIEPGTSKQVTIAPAKTGYDCIGIVPLWGGGTYYAAAVPKMWDAGTATARKVMVDTWNNSATYTVKNMYVQWYAIFRSKYGTETVAKWKRTA